MIWILTKLSIKVWMVMCIHAALEDLSIHSFVKKPCHDAQRADAITAGPSVTDSVLIPLFSSSPARVRSLAEVHLPCAENSRNRLSDLVVSRHAFCTAGCELKKIQCSLTTSRLGGHAVFVPRNSCSTRRRPGGPGPKVKFFCERTKMVTPRVGARLDMPGRCRQIFLPNNRFTYGIFVRTPLGFGATKLLAK